MEAEGDKWDEEEGIVQEEDEVGEEETEVKQVEVGAEVNFYFSGTVIMEHPWFPRSTKSL